MTAILLHCVNCGAAMQRKKPDRRARCRDCRRTLNAANQRAVRAAARALRPVVRRPCKACGAMMEPDAPTQAIYCRVCAADRIRAARRKASHRVRERRRELNHKETPTGGPYARCRADHAIQQGKCCRRCPTCYALYHLDTFEQPCPHCADHLTDCPTTFTEVPHVHVA